MNPVEAVWHLKTGMLKSHTFKRQQATRRVNNLQLSSLVEVENAHSSGINTIDLDKVEGR